MHKFTVLNRFLFVLFGIAFLSCKQERKEVQPVNNRENQEYVSYAKGFSIHKSNEGFTVIKVKSPWPGAETAYTYALVPKDKLSVLNLDRNAYDALVPVPVQRLVATSTTHIPALESLGVLDRLVGFPGTGYVSSKEARKRIDNGFIKELGNNESINTEMVIELDPEVVVGFSINSQNRVYETLVRSHIPVVYNGDWIEETPLGKAEWIKFFAPFFQLEVEAEIIFNEIESSYLEAKQLAKKAVKTPTVLSGALYKDVWYTPGGNSWAAQFLKDANADYIWKDTEETGSLSLSLESVLAKGQNVDFWVSPSQYTSYDQLGGANRHYAHFNAFKNQKIYTFARTVGETGGLLYYELAPQRPDLVLKDFIHIFHPHLLPEYQPFFFKPLQ